jgi:hypothetical protein
MSSDLPTRARYRDLIKQHHGWGALTRLAKKVPNSRTGKRGVKTSTLMGWFAGRIESRGIERAVRREVERIERNGLYVGGVKMT